MQGHSSSLYVVLFRESKLWFWDLAKEHRARQASDDWLYTLDLTLKEKKPQSNQMFQQFDFALGSNDLSSLKSEQRDKKNIEYKAL